MILGQMSNFGAFCSPKSSKNKSRFAKIDGKRFTFKILAFSGNLFVLLNIEIAEGKYTNNDNDQHHTMIAGNDDNFQFSMV